jgi:hypothetical protein
MFSRYASDHQNLTVLLFLFPFFPLCDVSRLFAVTSLESVVLQLQDSCHEARTEINELKQENSRIRVEFRERDKYWKAILHAKKSGQCPDPDNLPPTPPSFSPVHSATLTAPQIGPMGHYGPDHLGYRTSDDLSSSISNGPYHVPPGHTYPNTQSPSLSYTSVENEQIVGASSSHALSTQRLPKYGQYSYPMQPPNRSPHWNHSMTQAQSSGVESAPPHAGSSSHSPTYAESPTMTPSDMPYVGRYTVDGQKGSLNNLDTTYGFHTSRSMSPTGSAPSSSSSPSITSPFQFAFPEGPVGHSRQEYDYRRHNSGHGEVTLHGGTADIPLATSPSEAVRYRLALRRSDSAPERQMIASLPTVSSSDNGSPGERGSSEGESAPQNHRTRSRPRRGAALKLSRSPSPGGSPPISGTLAVIKAQAFGASWRTRTRTKKASEREAAKVALDVLEARGIGMGVSMPSGSKRPRHQSDDMDT